MVGEASLAPAEGEQVAEASPAAARLDAVEPMELDVETPKDLPINMANNSVEELKARCCELSAPVWGNKMQLLARVGKYTTKRRLEYEEQR
eukprot:1558139-Amphidinium_carterae.1